MIRCPVRPVTPVPAPTAKYPPCAFVRQSPMLRFTADSQQSGFGNTALCAGESAFSRSVSPNSSMNPCAYPAWITWSFGFRPRYHVGNDSEISIDLPCRGGITTSSRVNSPRSTASNAFATSRMCGGEWNGGRCVNVASQYFIKSFAAPDTPDVPSAARRRSR